MTEVRAVVFEDGGGWEGRRVDRGCAVVSEDGGSREGHRVNRGLRSCRQGRV